MIALFLCCLMLPALPVAEASNVGDSLIVGIDSNKTTAIRLIPAPGKTVGDTVEIGGLFGEAPVMPVHKASAEEFIARGGCIPAPLHSLKN